MKKLILAALILIPFSVQADESPCPYVLEVAESIMMARQAEVPIRVVLELAEGKLATTMVHQAYVLSPKSTEEGKLRQRIEFGNMWFLACLKATK